MKFIADEDLQHDDFVRLAKGGTKHDTPIHLVKSSRDGEQGWDNWIGVMVGNSEKGAPIGALKLGATFIWVDDSPDVGESWG